MLWWLNTVIFKKSFSNFIFLCIYSTAFLPFLSFSIKTLYKSKECLLCLKCIQNPVNLDEQVIAIQLNKLVKYIFTRRILQVKCNMETCVPDFYSVMCRNVTCRHHSLKSPWKGWVMWIYTWLRTPHFLESVILFCICMSCLAGSLLSWIIYLHSQILTIKKVGINANVFFKYFPLNIHYVLEFIPLVITKFS